MTEVLIIPIDGVEDQAATGLTGPVSAAFGDIPVTAGPGMPMPDGAYDARRKQYRTAVILTALAALRETLPPGQRHAVLLGLAAEDLFVPRLNFVFGQADSEQGVAVISTHRLRTGFYGQEGDAELLRTRTLKEAIHELGHVFGLAHCDDPGCIMHFSNQIADTDRKGPGFCSACRARLAARGIETP